MNEIIYAIKEHPDHLGTHWVRHSLHPGWIVAPHRSGSVEHFTGNEVDPIETSEVRSVTCFPVACRCRSSGATLALACYERTNAGARL
jgi:hypothetical protein